MRRLFPDNTFVSPKFGPSTRLVIAEAPGEEEQINGVPLVGGAGRWFDNLARKAGVHRDQINITNVIQCRPPDNIFPTDPDARKYISNEEGHQSVRHCLDHYVNPLLHSRPWTRIDLLGDKALEFVGGRGEGIFKWRGSPIPIPELGEKPIAIATLHPAYIARDQEFIPCVINDLKKNILPPPEFYNLYPSIDDVKAFTSKEVCFDIETAGWTKEITMIGISAKPYYVMLVPFRGPYVAEIKRIFNSATSVIGQNIIQFDLPVMAESGISITKDCQIWDTMLMQHLCFPSFPHDLEFIGSQFSSKPAWKHLHKQNEPLYCCRDVDVTYQSYKQLRPMLKSNQLEHLYTDVQVPLAKICKLMHTTGFKVDTTHIGAVREDLLAKMAKAETLIPEQLRTYQHPIKKRQLAPPGTLSEKTGKPIKYLLIDAEETITPWRSPTQKQAYLYGTTEPWMLGLPEQTDPKSGNVTTGKNALDKLYRKTKNPALLALKSLNKWDELVTTFCKETMTKIDRMYPHFNVHGTASGRLSSSDPNLQNIPEVARYIYVPTHPGWKLCEVDYSQIENRLTAYFAHDVERLARFQRDPKFSEHRYAASIFLGVPYDEVIKDSDPEGPYIKAKKIVHGTNYGEGSKKISMLNDLDFKETKELHDKWKNAIRPTIEWQNSCAEQAKREGYLMTPFGRRRWFYTSSYYTESLSFLPQSTAADIIFRVMIALMYERIDWPIEKVQQIVQVIDSLPQPARLLLQVHDSLLVEYPPEIEEQVILTLRRVMEQPWAQLGGMHIPIGIKTSDKSWGECEEYVF